MVVRGHSLKLGRGGYAAMTELVSHLQSRFGVVAVEKELITVDQLVAAMTIQLREDADGKPHRPIGATLADLGHMTPSQIPVVVWEIADSRG